jgi:maltoporin
MLAVNAARALLIAAAALAASRAAALEFHAYFRDSVGFNSFGGGQACFQLPGSDFKARLGNECERYLEAKLSETGTVGDTEWRGEFTAASYQPTTDGKAANALFLQEMWGSLKFKGWGGFSVWGGRRFFRRHDVHSIDWFYWNPAQGNAAAGVEDIDLAFGKAAVALIRIDATARGDTVKNLVHGTYAVPDLRLYDIATNPDGTLEIGVDLAIALDQRRALGADRAAVSPLFTIQHNQKILGGSNTLAFQYGFGAFAHASGDGPGQLLGGGTTGDRQWRIIEHLVANPVPQLSGAVVLVYQNKSSPGTSRNGASIFSAECRPAYHFGDYFKFAVDAFFQTLSIKGPAPGDGTPRLVKLTAAPTLVLGRGYTARPEFRLFLTYASWNDAAARAGTIGNGAFPPGARGGLSMGIHIEMWF